MTFIIVNPNNVLTIEMSEEYVWLLWLGNDVSNLKEKGYIPLQGWMSHLGSHVGQINAIL